MFRQEKLALKGEKNILFGSFFTNKIIYDKIKEKIRGEKRCQKLLYGF